MMLFVAGIIVGSVAMLFTMSLMVAAKLGDQRMETYTKR
jgi:hypothetical protein